MTSKKGSQRRPLYQGVTLLLLVAILAFAFRKPYLRLPLSWDENVWAYIGEHTLGGGFLPYRDVFDNKPPLVYVPFVLSEWILGHGWERLRFASAFLSSSTTVFLSAVVYASFGFAPALLVGAAEAIYGVSPPSEGNYMFITGQVIKLLLVALLALCVHGRDTGCLWRWRGKTGWLFLLMGFLSAAASLVRQTYIALAVAWVILLVLTEKTGRKAKVIMYALGFGLPYLALTGLYVAQGAVGDLIEGLFGYNVTRVVGMPTAQAVASRFHAVLGDQRYILLAGVVLGVAALVSARTRRFSLVAWMYLAIGMLSILAGGNRLFGHYFLFLTFPLYLLLGPGLAALPQRVRWGAGLILCAVLVRAAPGQLAYAQQIVSAARFPDPALVSFLRSQVSTEDTFFFADASFFYYYEFQARAPTRFVDSVALTFPDMRPEKLKLIETLRVARCTWIVTDMDSQASLSRDPEFMSFLQERYEKRLPWGGGEIWSVSGKSIP